MLVANHSPRAVKHRANFLRPHDFPVGRCRAGSAFLAPVRVMEATGRHKMSANRRFFTIQCRVVPFRHEVIHIVTRWLNEGLEAE
jgi:hypothetical protein